MRIYAFWADLVQKSKLSVYAEIWHQEYLEYAKFHGAVHFSLLDWKYTFWANLVQ